MNTQFNFQMKPRNDRRDWEDVEIYYQTYCDRKTALHFARCFSKKYQSEIRLTEGKEPLKTSGTYILNYKP
jgi:tryptophan synthase beta subunit